MDKRVVYQEGSICCPVNVCNPRAIQVFPFFFKILKTIACKQMNMLLHCLNTECRIDPESEMDYQTKLKLTSLMLHFHDLGSDKGTQTA